MASPGRERIDITDDLAFVGEQIEALERLGGREDVDDERVYDLSIRWAPRSPGGCRAWRTTARWDNSSNKTSADSKRCAIGCANCRP
ncbi:hypothetical protein MAHJHV64_30990 [Mycobacterium avium subsp. hominissuis]